MKNSKLILALPWLVKRMETLRGMQPPTLQEVDAQLKASANFEFSISNF